MIKVTVSEVISNATNLEVLTAGMVNGRAVEFALSPEWEGLNKTAVFTNGLETRIVPEYKWTDGRIVYIPPEVLSTPHRSVKCGIYGIDTEGKLVIPTLWAELGRVFPSASPNEYEESVPPTPNIWDDLQNQIGVLSKLDTKEKRNLVGAINEVLANAITNAVRSINNVLPDENGNVSLDEILFTAFVEEGVIQPVYCNESVVFTDENGAMFVYDPVNQNIKVNSGQASITVNGVEPDDEGNIAVKFTINGIEPDENGNIDLPIYKGEYEEIYEGEYEEVTSNE